MNIHGHYCELSTLRGSGGGKTNETKRPHTHTVTCAGVGMEDQQFGHSSPGPGETPSYLCSSW